jgi:hypothetical protein
MNQEEVVASNVLLAHPIKAVDRESHDTTLETIGDAAGFLLANFSRARSAESDWTLAASVLERAAETDMAHHVVHATNAVIALLENEKLIRR